MLGLIKRSLNHPGVRRYGANTLWLVAERVYRMGLGLLVFTWIARHLGPTDFGILGFSHTFVLLFAIFANLGLDGIVLRELTTEKRPRSLMMGTAFGLKLVGALLMFPMLTIGLTFTTANPDTSKLIYIIALAHLFESFNVIDFHFQSKVLSKYVAWGNTAAVTVSSTLKVGFILADASVVAFATMLAVEMAFYALGFLYFYKYTGEEISRWRFDLGTAKYLLSESWTLLLSGMVVAVYMKIDQVMLKEMLDATAVGQYAAAARLSEATYFIAAVITGSVFPALAEAHAADRALYERRLVQLFSLMVIIGLGLSIPVTFLADWVIELLYGAQFQQAAAVLVIHIWSGMFIFLGLASARWYYLDHLQHLAVIRTGTGAVINVALNLYLIESHGIIGAAYATLISYAFANFFSYLLHPKLIPLFVLTARAFNPLRLVRDGLKL